MALPDYNVDEISEAIQRADYEFVLKYAMPYALAGNSYAQCEVALAYQCGWGVQRDILEAERWLLKATAQNNPMAWHNLGTLYSMQHPELEQKWGEGRKCWERAKELGFNCVPNRIHLGYKVDTLDDEVNSK
jgi:TPR repeat protein